MHNSLIDGELTWGSQELTQGPRGLGLCAQGLQVVNIFQLVGGFTSAEHLRKFASNTICIPGEGQGNLLQYSRLENTHGQRNLGVYSPWGHKESDMTE